MSNENVNKISQQEQLADILTRISSEFRDVALLIERMEPIFACQKIAAVIEAHEHMNLLQGVDLAVQKANGLADFVEAISDQVDAELLVDLTTALNLITLSDLKNRLSCANESVASADNYEKASGDLDFF